MKRVLFFLLIIFLAVNVNAQDKMAIAEKAMDKKDYKKAFDIAKELYEAKDYNSAKNLFIQLRQVEYGGVDLYIYLGDAYSKMGVNELAVSNYEEAERLDSTNISLKMKTAKLLVEQANYTGAVNKYLKIIKLDPQNKSAYLEAANILYRAKMYLDAAKMYEEYLKLDNTKDAYQKIINAFYISKNYEKVYTYGLKCLELYGDDNQIKKYVATASLYLKKYNDAAKYYAQLPDSMLSVNEMENVARTFQQVNDDVNAMKYFEKVIKRDSTRANLYMELGNGFYRDKKYTEAIKWYEAKTKSDSTYEPAWKFLGVSYFQLEKYEDSRKALVKAVALSDTNITTRQFLISTYTKLDSTQARLEQYKEIIKLIGNRELQYKDQLLEAVSNVGYNFMQRKNYAAAIPYLLKLNKYKSDVNTLLSLSSAYLSVQNQEEAINYARRVLKIDPNNKDAKKILRSLSAD